MVAQKTIYIYDDNIGSVSLVDSMGTDVTVVNSARVSFGVEKDELDTKDKRLIRYLIRHRHTSTLEHNIVTFRFCVPLFVRSQHMRHRTWSYNEISRRYTDVGLRFYETEKLRTQHKSNRQASNEDDIINPGIDYQFPGSAVPGKKPASDLIKKHHEDSLKLFDQLIDAGVCREQARGVLPQNLYTEYYGTCNLNNLIKFVNLRIHEGAQQEIRVVAEACKKIATDLWPVAMESLKENKS